MAWFWWRRFFAAGLVLPSSSRASLYCSELPQFIHALVEEKSDLEIPFMRISHVENTQPFPARLRRISVVLDCSGAIPAPL